MYRALFYSFIHLLIVFTLWLLWILLLWTQIILGFSKRTEPIRYIRGDSLNEFTHGAMKVKKPQNLPSESWRTKKPWWSNLEWKLGGWRSKSQYESESLRTRSTKVQGQEEMKSQSSRDSEFTLPHLAQLFRPSLDWMMPSGTDEGNLLCSYSDVNLFWRCPHRYTRK